MQRDESDPTALFDFVAQFQEDRARGVERNLADYLSRFPDCEEAVALEYCRLQGKTLAPAVVHPDDPSAPRYARLGEIARGGMGQILRVRDEALQRDLAMKVAIRGGATSQARLTEESLLTGALDHPGVVPVHDRGLDETGRAFFTMRLVEGRDLREVIRMVHRLEEGWSMPRALEVLLKVCDTVAFAHSRGVVHRDLKPSNVRVGSFGEVYVLDWGLAKRADRRDLHDLTIRKPSVSEGGGGATRADVTTHEDSPLVTMDGDVIGTPCAMSPEQAAGRISEVGPRSDVYSIGAMLYELLSGVAPYIEPKERATPAAILQRVLTGPPTPIEERAPDPPPELAAICRKAMERDPAARYRDMREMASDLRAFLDSRVVAAYRTGRLERMSKWIARNRTLSAAIAATIVVSIAALASIVVLQRRNANRLRLVADSRTPSALVEEFAEIHPDGAAQVPAMERWLAEATDLMSRTKSYREEFDQLHARALPWNVDDERETADRLLRDHKLRETKKLLAYYRSEEARIAAEGGLSDEGFPIGEVRRRRKEFEVQESKWLAWKPTQLTWRFADPKDQHRHDTIATLLASMAPLLDTPDTEGLLSRMERRIASARRTAAEPIEAMERAWAAAISSIQDAQECPRYQGLRLAPQAGLVPIRRDPTSGLWEFLHFESGDPPDVNPDGSYRLEEGTGIILVLLPESVYEEGAQHESPSQPNFDPEAQSVEWRFIGTRPATVHAMLDAFFISKYEMTQAQWLRITGRNPSKFTAVTHPEDVHSELHPVEEVSWRACTQVTEQIGLALPTEAQWEFAARGNSATPWWTGADRSTLEGAANIADSRASSTDATLETEWSDWPELDDGFAFHAPVGSFRPNAFGLYDVCGNVSEWCRDPGAMAYSFSGEVRIGSFERFLLDEGLRVHRGGSFALRASACRSAARAFTGPDRGFPDTGLRPSRDLDP